MLRAADPSVDYWTFRGPNPLRWWLRRLANETAVHRVDAEQAAGWDAAVDAAFAADGIDEKLETYLPVIVHQHPPERPVTVAFRADDVGAAWTVTVGDDVSRSSGTRNRRRPRSSPPRPTSTCGCGNGRPTSASRSSATPRPSTHCAPPPASEPPAFRRPEGRGSRSR